MNNQFKSKAIIAIEYLQDYIEDILGETLTYRLQKNIPPGLSGNDILTQNIKMLRKIKTDLSKCTNEEELLNLRDQIQATEKEIKKIIAKDDNIDI